MDEIRYKPVGIIHSPFKEPKGTPIQPSAAQDIKGIVEVFPEYVEALKNLDGFSHIILLFHFHLARSFSPRIKPYMDDNPRGLFATRAPSRPNPIGLSIVRLDRIEKEKLHIRDVDIVDGTPLLDIKPYVSEFDAREKVKIGWLVNRVSELKHTKDDGRFNGEKTQNQRR